MAELCIGAEVLDWDISPAVPEELQHLKGSLLNLPAPQGVPQHLPRAILPQLD